jgi:hypothetical protein
LQRHSDFKPTAQTNLLCIHVASPLLLALRLSFAFACVTMVLRNLSAAEFLVLGLGMLGYKNGGAADATKQ